MSSLPIVALMTFDEDAETLAGVTGRGRRRRSAELPVAATARTTAPACSPRRCARADARRRSPAALPNIGPASLAGGRVIYPHATLEYFAEFAAHARDLGAWIIGGRCGRRRSRSPRSALLSRRSADRTHRSSSPSESSQWPSARSSGRPVPRAPCGRASGSPDPARPATGGSNLGLIEVAQALRDTDGVGFVDLNDNLAARARQNGLMAAVAIEREARSRRSRT